MQGGASAHSYIFERALVLGRWRNRPFLKLPASNSVSVFARPRPTQTFGFVHLGRFPEARPNRIDPFPG